MAKYFCSPQTKYVPYICLYSLPRLSKRIVYVVR